MKKNDLFSPNLWMNLPRNAFPLEHGKKFSLVAGMLQPVLCEEVLPGDRFDCRLSSIVRTLPLNTAAFGKLDVNYDFFFVPSRLLWSQFPQWLARVPYSTNRTQLVNSSIPNPPFLTNGQIYDYLDTLRTNAYKDEVNSSFFSAASRLFSLLGYGTDAYVGNNSFMHVSTESGYGWLADNNWRNTRRSVLPLAAYNRIYQDFYRQSEWENPDYRYANLDQFDSTTGMGQTATLVSDRAFRMRYCSYKKDYFMGLHPHMQFGDQAVVDTLNHVQKVGVGSVIPGAAGYRLISSASDNHVFMSTSLSSSAYVQANFSIYDLRLRQSLQHWKEVFGTTPQHYKALMKALTGVDVPETLSNSVEFIDGFSNVLNIDEVIATGDGTNSDASTSSSLGQIAGRGVATSSGDKMISYTAKEPGFFICIMYIRPDIDYNAFGVDPLLDHVEREDYFDEIQDRIGLAPVRQYALDQGIMDSTYSSNQILGYGNAYLEYKTKVSKCYGTFVRGGMFAAWSVNHPKNLTGNSGLSYIDMLVNPSCLDPIFFDAYGGSGASDQFLCNLWFDLKAARNMSGTTLP